MMDDPVSRHAGTFASESRIPIPTLDPSKELDATKHIEAIVTLLWPYSSATESLAMLIAAPDMRLRRNKGQIRVCLRGPAARQVASAHVGIGDKIHLALQGAKWLEKPPQDTIGTPGRSVDGELLFQYRLLVQTQRNNEQPTYIDINDPVPVAQSPASSRDQSESPEPFAQTPAPKQSNFRQSWTTPFKIKSSPLGSSPMYDPFLDDETIIDDRGGKRTKFGRKSSEWRYVGRSPPDSPSRAPAHVEDDEGQSILDSTIDALPSTLEIPATPLSPAATPRGPVIEIDEAPADPFEDARPSRPSLSIPDTSTQPLFQNRVPTTVNNAQLTASIPATPSSPNLRPVASPSLPLVSPLVFSRVEHSASSHSFSDSAAAATAVNLRASQPSMLPLPLDDSEQSLTPKEGTKGGESVPPSSAAPFNDTAGAASMRPHGAWRTSDESQFPLLSQTSPLNASTADMRVPKSDQDLSSLQVPQNTDVSTSLGASVEFSPSVAVPFSASETQDGPSSFASPTPQGPEASQRDVQPSRSRREGSELPSPVDIDINDPVFQFFESRNSLASTDQNVGAVGGAESQAARVSQHISNTTGQPIEAPADVLPATQYDPPGRSLDPLPFESQVKKVDTPDVEHVEMKDVNRSRPETLHTAFAQESLNDAKSFIEHESQVTNKNINTDEQEVTAHDTTLAQDGEHASATAKPSKEDVALSITTEHEAQEEANDQLAPLPVHFPQLRSSRNVEYQSFTSISEDERPARDLTSSPLPHAQPKTLELESSDNEGRDVQERETFLFHKTGEPSLPPKQTSGEPNAEASLHHSAASEVERVVDSIQDQSISLDESAQQAPGTATQDPSEQAHDSTSDALPADAVQTTPRHRVDQILDGVHSDFTPTTPGPIPSAPQVVQLEDDMDASKGKAPSTEPARDHEIHPAPNPTTAPPAQSDPDPDREPEPSQPRKSTRLRSAKIPEVLSPWFSSKKGRPKTPSKDQQPTTSGSTQAEQSIEDASPSRKEKRQRHVTIQEPNVPPRTRMQTRSMTPTLTEPQTSPKPQPQPQAQSPTKPKKQTPPKQKSPTIQSTTELSRTAGLRTNLAYYAPLSSIDVYINASSSTSDAATLDIFGIVTQAPSAPRKAKTGPKDHFTVFDVADATAWPSSVRVECYRPYKRSLPDAGRGDVVLLRGMVVISRGGEGIVLSAAASAWCVWKFSTSSVDGDADDGSELGLENLPNEEVKGPPVEVGDGEREHVLRLRKWWLNVKDQPLKSGKGTPKASSARKDRKRKAR